MSLLRGAGLKRIASRGLRLWAACARRCPLSAELTLSAAQARRLGLKPGRAKRYEVASARTTATGTPRLLMLKVRRDGAQDISRAPAAWPRCSRRWPARPPTRCARQS